MSNRSKEFIHKLVGKADIQINGTRPWDIAVHDERFYSRVSRQGSLGLGESYMDGWWDVPQLDEFFNKLLSTRIYEDAPFDFRTFINFLRGKLINFQKLIPFYIGKHHYDVGNDLYKMMLGERMAYTCGYWKDAHTLEEAQEKKMDLVCKKLNLKKGQKVLDIGSGWGSFIRFAAERYGVHAVGVSVSKEQVDFANVNKGNLSIETRFIDYRDIGDEKFDHIVSLGMFEHVGYKNYREFMKKVESLLKDDGLFLLHTIGSNSSVVTNDPWAAKYIFPNSMLPSIKQIGESVENIFVMEDWHNFSADYDKTLMHWFKNFDTSWGSLSEKYGDRFYRMWKYYLLMYAGSFRSRENQLWQIVFSKKGVNGGYASIR